MSGLEADIALIEGLMAFANTKHSKVIADRAGVDPGTLQKKLNGQDHNRLSQRTIDKLRAAFPNFPGWTKPAAGETRQSFTYPNYITDKRQLEADTVELEQIDLRYGMGGTFADGPVEVERRPFSRAWLRSITAAAPRHLFWAMGDGDSMEPTIRSGEVILIDRSQETPRMDDGIWAVTHGEIGMIKRLRHRPDGQVELHSDNHLVRPQTAVDGELHVVGRVIAVVRKL
jgi:phage repressor protein C with HTH and peptisase S24 domain